MNVIRAVFVMLCRFFSGVTQEKSHTSPTCQAMLGLENRISFCIGQEKKEPGSLRPVTHIYFWGNDGVPVFRAP